MKNLKITTFTIFIIVLLILGIKKYNYLKFNNDKIDNKKVLINESFRVLTECLDLENKNKRTLKKSIELIEFCIEEYGYKE